MNKIIAWFKIIRINNLLIIILTQYLIKYCIINYFVNDFTLSDINFLILVISTTLIAAAGYIINDIYDIETDKINRKNKVLIGELISIQEATFYYITINIIGLITGTFLVFNIGKPLLIIIFFYSIYSLWIYSKKLKKKLLIGNIKVALLTSLPIINIALFDILPNGININSSEITIFKIILIYAAFAIITTLVREIIKDMQDIKGDKKINANTLPIKYGIKVAINTSLILISLIIIGISYFQYFQYSVISSEFEYEISIWGVNIISIIYTIIIQISLLILCKKIYRAKNVEQFYFTSKLCKKIMILGILTIPLFTYLHLN